MNVTIELVGDSRVRVDDAEVTTRSEGEVAFRAEGTLRLTEALVSEFAGRRLTPEAVAFSVDDAQIVEVALEDEASLQLETVDVGVETPESDDVPTDADEARSLADDFSEAGDSVSAALAFTVAGVVENVPADDFAALSAGGVVPASITFSVGENPETDGGSPDDGLFEFGVLGYAIVVWANGTIVVRRGSEDATGLL